MYNWGNKQIEHKINFFLQWTSNAPIKAELQMSHDNIFKHNCVKGNTINKTNGTEGLNNLNWEAQRLWEYSQETKY